MARLRTIKPGFFLDDVLAEVEPLGRLLFAGLWTVADREGRLEDRPKKIKVEVLPYDSCDVDALLDDLWHRGFIVRYKVGDTPYIAIPGWHRHQNPHIKEAPSSIPAPPDTCPDPPEHSASTVQAPCEHGTKHNLNRHKPGGNLGLGTWDLETERSSREAKPVDNSTASDPAGSVEKKKTTRLQTKACDGAKRSSCPCLCLNVDGLRQQVARIVGITDAGKVDNADDDLGRTARLFADRLCGLMGHQFSHLSRPEKDALCQEALVQAMSVLADYHEEQPQSGKPGITNLAAFLQSKITAATQLGDLVGDDYVTELRSRTVAPAGKPSTPRQMGDVMRKRIADLAASEAS